MRRSKPDALAKGPKLVLGHLSSEDCDLLLECLNVRGHGLFLSPRYRFLPLLAALGTLWARLDGLCRLGRARQRALGPRGLVWRRWTCNSQSLPWACGLGASWGHWAGTSTRCSSILEVSQSAKSVLRAAECSDNEWIHVGLLLVPDCVHDPVLFSLDSVIKHPLCNVLSRGRGRQGLWGGGVPAGKAHPPPRTLRVASELLGNRVIERKRPGPAAVSPGAKVANISFVVADHHPPPLLAGGQLVYC
mmetsp:Transcript_25578/g.81386  ORF Transcript_25578/g.81386 Transcript_25578/m.81386 type:complete len:247 (-) Transcript_25578:99-839(-)